MESRWLGTSGIRFSRFGIGTGAFPEAGAPQHGARLLVDAARRGVTFWDTANNYDTYREIRLALARLGVDRARIIISSKLEAKTARAAVRQIDRCLRDIGRDWVDVMLLHYVQEPLARWRGAIEALRKAKRRGDVLAIGLSTHNPRFVREAIAMGVMDCVFVTLNVAGSWVEGRGGNAACLPRRHEDLLARRRQEMIRAAQDAKRAGLGVVILKVLGCGQLATQKARAIRWAVQRPFADGVIIGVETIAQVRENLGYFA